MGISSSVSIVLTFSGRPLLHVVQPVAVTRVRISYRSYECNFVKMECK